jgi:hypothetical protein
MVNFNFRERSHECLRQIIQIFVTIRLYNVANIGIIGIDFVSYS